MGAHAGEALQWRMRDKQLPRSRSSVISASTTTATIPCGTQAHKCITVATVLHLANAARQLGRGLGAPEGGGHRRGCYKLLRHCRGNPPIFVEQALAQLEQHCQLSCVTPPTPRAKRPGSMATAPHSPGSPAGRMGLLERARSSGGGGVVILRQNRRRRLLPAVAESEFQTATHRMQRGAVISSFLLCLGIGLAATSMFSESWFHRSFAVSCFAASATVAYAVVLPSYRKRSALRGQVRDSPEDREPEALRGGEARPFPLPSSPGTPDHRIFLELTTADRTAVLRSIAQDQADAFQSGRGRPGRSRPRAQWLDDDGDDDSLTADLIAHQLIQDALLGELRPQSGAGRFQAATGGSSALAGTGPSTWARATRRPERSRRLRPVVVSPQVSQEAFAVQALVISRTGHAGPPSPQRAAPSRAAAAMARAVSEPRVRGSEMVRGAAGRRRPAEPAEAPASQRQLSDFHKDDCAICMEPLRSACARCAGAAGTSHAPCNVACGTCGHMFHICCIGDWAVSCARDGREPKCPVDNSPWRYRSRNVRA